MDLGPNMKRLRELDVGNTVKACVIAGPGDLMVWEVSACVHRDGFQLDVVGRGSDMEAAAALAMSIVTEHGSRLPASPDELSDVRQPAAR